jgi:ABC-type transport system involved in multi-copper enzyme maturation permease subunit
MRNRWRPPPMLGPLFGYDLVASTRRGQHSGLRVLIAGLLLVTLFVVYAFHIQGFDPFANPFKAGPRIDPKAMANLTATFSRWCMIVQFGVVILLTPVIVADAIAREKERRALDFLFVTELTDREIILGKLGSRLAYLIGVLLTCLPILAMTQLFGGVDPNVLLSEYAALLSTLFSLGALSLYCSVVSSTALQATVRAYAAAVGYLFACPCVLYPVVNSDVAVPGLIIFVAANVGLAAVLVTVSIHDLRPRAELLPPMPVMPTPRRAPLVKIRPAVANVTMVETEAADDLPFVLPAADPPIVDASGAPVDVRGWDPVDWRSLDRPAVWEPPELDRPALPPVDERRPLLWKEVYLHSIAGSAPGGPVAVGVLIVLAVVPAGIIWLAIAAGLDSGGELTGFSTSMVRVGTVIFGALLGIGAIAHSVSSVSREYEKDTLDGLLTLPVTRDTVMAAKWLGGLVSLRLLIVALAGLWLFGLATRALAVAAVVEFLASLGLWLSVVCKTSLRANMAAVLGILMVGAGPWVMSQYIDLLSPYSGAHRVAADAVMEMAMPARAWSRLCVGWAEYAKAPAGLFPTILLGALAYSTTAWLLWRAALSRFRKYGGKRA